MPWIFFLLKKYLFLSSKKGMRFIMVLTILGVMLGVGTLTLTQAVLSGFQKEFQKSILGFNAHLVVLKEGEMEDPIGEENRMKGWLGSDLKAATPFFYRETLLIHQGKVKGGVLKGIDPLTFRQVYDVGVRSLQTGQQIENVKELFNSPTPYPALILGEDLASELGVSKDQPLVKVFVSVSNQRFHSQEDKKLPQGETVHTPQSFQWFQVVGLFSSGLYEFDRNFAFGQLGTLQNIFNSQGKVSGIEMTLANPQRAEELASRLKEKLGLLYQVVSWQQLNAPLFQALKIERVMFFVIMAMVVGVASFNIVGIILLMIFEKGKEISILRSLGGSYRSIKRLFGFQGIFLGGMGVLLGLVLGWGIALLLKVFPLLHLEKEVYLVDRLPVEFSWDLVLWIVGVALLIILISSQIAVSRIEKAPLDL